MGSLREEVRPRRCQRDTKPVRHRLQPIGLQYLAREPGFRWGQSEILAEALAADDGSLVRIGDEEDRSRPDDIDPREPSTVRYHEHGQGRPMLAGQPDAPAVAAKPAEPAKPAEAKVATSRPALKPSVADGAADSGQMAGAAPIVQSNSFDSRFSAMK